ncbi:peptidase M6 [Kineococcus sp. SYSU DK006]|uniref:peptidase M6 n=1 Tax=Kineococcus sp. SYSU DK006 TaxID=3383127 RepID=UPI003D7E003A
MGPHPSRRGRLTLAALCVTALAVPVCAVSAAAAPRTAAQQAPADVRVLGGDYNGGAPLPLVADGGSAAAGRSTLAAPRAADGELAVGARKDWPSLVDGGVTPDGEPVESGIDVRGYTLRGLGENIELWVADDLSFPEGDCRNEVGGGELTRITDEQVAGFVREFDETILPAESRAFSVAPDRDGSGALLDEALEGAYPADYWAGEGRRTVALIDNVRDQNYFDPTNENGRTYIAGFFYSTFNELLDRNVMTIDGFDWLHRTGENPPDDSQDADYRACAEFLQRPGLGEPSPRTYEGTFGHEYQHLLQYYADPDEVSWVNEGLSMWAEDLLDFSDPRPAPDTEEADSYIRTFLGFNEQRSYGGPEQSLTQWGEQGAPEILADYGSAYAFMLYVHDHFGGEPFMKALHNEPEGGLAGLDAVLDDFGHRRSAQDVLHDFVAAMAVDNALDRGAKTRSGKSAKVLSTASLSAKVNWDSPQSHASPGAPVNGADYVRLRDARGYLSNGLVTFNGARSYPTTPVEWTVEDGALVSGSGSSFDRGLVRTVAVPAQDPTITLDLDVAAEEGYDFFVVQVFDPAKGGWVSLSSEDTTSEDAGTEPRISANLPGLTGEVSGEQTYDASAYAGKDVQIALRYLTDGGVDEPGVTVRSVAVGGQPLAGATDLSTWQSITQAHPVPVAGWTVQLVGYDAKRVSVVQLPVVQTRWGWSTAAPVAKVLGFTPDVAAVIVTADDPTESAPAPAAPYNLSVNGVLQPGGLGG